MTSNVKSLGDTTLRANVPNLADPLVTHFFNAFSQVPQARDNPLKGMGIEEHPISGASLSVPVKQGVLAVRDQQIGGDRTLKGVRHQRPAQRRCLATARFGNVRRSGRDRAKPAAVPGRQRGRCDGGDEPQRGASLASMH